MDFNNQDVLIDCPQCKKELVVKILEITNHTTVKCPHCGKKIDLAENDPSARLDAPKNYLPFDGLDQYIDQVNQKRSKKK